MLQLSAIRSQAGFWQDWNDVLNAFQETGYKGPGSPHKLRAPCLLRPYSFVESHPLKRLAFRSMQSRQVFRFLTIDLGQRTGRS